LLRALVVGPIARWELVAAEGGNPSGEPIIEAQIPASQYRDEGFKACVTLLLSPRKARVLMAA